MLTSWLQVNGLLGVEKGKKFPGIAPGQDYLPRLPPGRAGEGFWGGFWGAFFCAGFFLPATRFPLAAFLLRADHGSPPGERQ
jgi:hypothetical protein